MGVNGNIHSVHFSEMNRMLNDCVFAIGKNALSERALRISFQTSRKHYLGSIIEPLLCSF